jgi:hypothetical protein
MLHVRSVHVYNKPSFQAGCLYRCFNTGKEEERLKLTEEFMLYLNPFKYNIVI